MTAEERKQFLLKTVDFYYCPNSGLIIEGTKHDDKIICTCRKTNPKISSIGYHESKTGRLVHHIKRFLVPASIEDFLKQEEIKIYE